MEGENNRVDELLGKGVDTSFEGNDFYLRTGSERREEFGVAENDELVLGVELEEEIVDKPIIISFGKMLLWEDDFRS